MAFRSTLIVFTLMVLSSFGVRLLAAPKIAEISADNVDLLPGGKEADGIIGDFVMWNDQVKLVISGNLPLRRPNMSAYYGADGITPGCLYDLTLLGQANDQITLFSPSGQRSSVSYVRIASDGSDGEAVIETVVSAARNNGLYKRHEYRLRDGYRGVVIVTTMRNEADTEFKGSVNDRWKDLGETGDLKGIRWGNAVDPDDRAGYAYTWIKERHYVIPAEEVILAPGEEITFARFLAVGHSPLHALGEIVSRGHDSASLFLRLEDPAGQAVASATVTLTNGEEKVIGYPDAKGELAMTVPPGDYHLEVEDGGRKSLKQTMVLRQGARLSDVIKLGAQSKIAFAIRESHGARLPCKIQVIGVGETPTPDFGPPNRAHGCANQYHSADGLFSVAVAPGRYEVIVTRGLEYNHIRREVLVRKGETLRFSGTLHRVVDSSGWISADYHNHSTESGDNTCATDDRIINLAAEHIEFAPTTEHNRIYDWAPHIESLGLQDFVYTVPGIELTGQGTHFNAFPLKPDPFAQDGGAPVWKKDPRLNALTLRDFQNLDPWRWVHVNHPNMSENFFDRDADGTVDGGYVGLGAMIDAIETQNGERADILSRAPFEITRGAGGVEAVSQIREFAWLQLLNQGVRMWGIAVSDAHSVFGNGVGGWRHFVPSSTDSPKSIDWKEISRRSRAGQMVLTSGPFLEVLVDGALPGADIRARGAVSAQIKVQCTDWIDIDRVQILVNGRQEPTLNFTRSSHPDWFGDGVVKFDRSIDISLQSDAHLIVVATGESHTLKTGFGESRQAKLKPCAYNNPIFVDVDGGGFQANGDTLGFPLLVGDLEPAMAKELLRRDGLWEEEGGDAK